MNAAKSVYALPDGNELSLSAEKYTLAEILFTATPRRADHKVLHHLLHETIRACSTDLRKDLFSNIVLAGGGSLVSGLPDRLENEIVLLAPATQRVKVIAAGNERKYSSWIGGSILGSLGTFDDFCITKEDYRQWGGSVVEKKCP
jgi:actin-related protein